MARYAALHALAFGALLLAALPVAATAEDRLHHDLELTLDPATSRLEVIDRIDVKGQEQLALKLAPGLTLGEVVVDNEAVSPGTDDGVIWIELPAGDDHRVELAYGGVLETGESRGQLAALLAPEGGFLPYGIGWLANGGAEDDAVTYRLTVTVPAPFKAVATGALTVETDDGESYSATFEASHPTEPPSVFAGDLQVDERDHGGLRLRTYFPADQQQLSATYLDQAAGYIDLFEGRIGDYPYDGFSMIAAPLPVGMGFPGLTYISAQILGMPFMQTRSLAHEILHNWWANGVFIDQSEGNWAEGLTTYMADYALAEAEGADSAEEMRLGWLRDFAALPAERDQPITAFRSKGHDADQVIGYNKVAMVFHMLRQELGEEAFTAGIKRFWADHKFNTASWSDLQASFAAAAGGRNLSRFFEPWLNQTGAPALTLEKTEIEERDSGFALNLRLSSDLPDYDLLVPVQIEIETGIEQTTIRLNGGDATIETDKKPLSIGIDQRHDLFRRLAANEAPPILRDVTLDQNALTVIATNGQAAAGDIAEQLAARTLDTEVRLVGLDDGAIATSPLMVVGLTSEMGPALSKVGIEAAPAGLKDRGTARSWVAKRQDAPPVLVVEAADEEALGALLRPLPHYGRQSFLVFEGRKVVDKGVWPTGDNALTKRFD